MSLLDDDYFYWLISQIKHPRTKTFDGLFRKMHSVDFLWVIDGDDNRVHDAFDLRCEFIQGSISKPAHMVVSVLEMIVALSRRVAFISDGDADTWAWKLIRNLGLDRMSDPIVDHEMMDNILYNLIWRQYDPSGLGGFFPLMRPEGDQTHVELWVQMNSYVREMYER